MLFGSRLGGANVWPKLSRQNRIVSGADNAVLVLVANQCRRGRSSIERQRKSARRPTSQPISCNCVARRPDVVGIFLGEGLAARIRIRASHPSERVRVEGWYSIPEFDRIGGSRRQRHLVVGNAIVQIEIEDCS